LQPSETYSVGINIVIQTDLSKRETGYAIQELPSGVWIAWLESTVVQSHYDQTMTAPATQGTYTYRVWGESGPATSGGKADFDDYTITVQAPTNSPPVLTQLINLNGDRGVATGFSATATDADGDPLVYTWNFGDGSPLVVGNPVTHSYSTIGNFTFTVYVDDSHAHNVSSSATASIAFVLNLVKGWNLVSVPGVGFGYKASTLGLLTNDVVVGWNPATQTYDKSYVVGVSLPFKDFSVEPGTGYWIFASAAETLHLKGTIPAGPQSRSVVTPGPGSWVTVGFNSLRTWQASQLPAMYSGGSITQVLMFNATTMTYKTYNPSLPFTDFAIAPGNGLWILVTASGTWTYTP
jgi:hypothetical protein